MMKLDDRQFTLDDLDRLEKKLDLELKKINKQLRIWSVINGVIAIVGFIAWWALLITDFKYIWLLSPWVSGGITGSLITALNTYRKDYKEASSKL